MGYPMGYNIPCPWVVYPMGSHTPHGISHGIASETSFIPWDRHPVLISHAHGEPFIPSHGKDHEVSHEKNNGMPHGVSLIPWDVASDILRINYSHGKSYGTSRGTFYGMSHETNSLWGFVWDVPRDPMGFSTGFPMGCPINISHATPYGTPHEHPTNILWDALYMGHLIGCRVSHGGCQTTAACCCVTCPPGRRSAFLWFYRIVIVFEIPTALSKYRRFLQFDTFKNVIERYIDTFGKISNTKCCTMRIVSQPNT